MAAIGKQIDIFPQTLKGLCIIIVVMIHLPWGVSGEETAYLWIGARKIVNFAVATFFFLSGYYNHGVDRNYLYHRLKRLLIPYVIWTCVYVFVIPYLTTGAIDREWFFYIFTGKGPLYFLLVLTQFTLLSPLLWLYKKNRALNILFWSITPIYIIFYYWYNFNNGIEFKPEQFFCFPWFACYYLGMKMQNWDSPLREYSISPILMFFICLGLLMLSMIEAMFIYAKSGIFSFAISQITIGSILYSLGVIVLFNTFWKDGRNESRNMLTRLGDYSMGIFLMHPTFNWMYKFVFIHIPYGESLYNTTFGFMMIHIMVLVLSVSTCYFVSKELSKKFPYLIKPLGLK